MIAVRNPPGRRGEVVVVVAVPAVVVIVVDVVAVFLFSIFYHVINVAYENMSIFGPAFIGCILITALSF